MCGEDERTEGMFSYVLPEQRVPHDHPLRPIREIVDRRWRRSRRSLPSCTR